MARGDLIVPSDLPQSLRRVEQAVGSRRDRDSSAASRADTLDDAERDYLITLLKTNFGNVSHSAVQAGMSRQGLHKLLKKHGLKAGDYRE
jgi:two-component system response regulator HydG